MIPTFSSPETCYMWTFLEEKDLNGFCISDCKGTFNTLVQQMFQKDSNDIMAKLMKSALMRVDWDQIQGMIEKRQTGQSVELTKVES